MNYYLCRIVRRSTGLCEYRVLLKCQDNSWKTQAGLNVNKEIINVIEYWDLPKKGSGKYETS